MSRLFFAVAFLLAGLACLHATSPSGFAQEAKPESTDAVSIPETVSRPDVPSTPPNPNELKIVPDEHGRVQFNFEGQPWQAVVEWLAQSSKLSLDWQELPNGFLNLHTEKSYSLVEARDLINRHLLDRGFTLLKNGEVLSVSRIAKLDPSLVPRLEPDELTEAMPHEFVRVTFPLEWMTAEVAVEDLKPLISPNGKLTTIKSSNNLEAMDAVANLRDIRRLISDPESPRGPRRLVKQFQLEHARASEVQSQLQKLLGLEKNTASDPGAVMQQMATFMKNAGLQPGELAKAKGAQPPPVHIVANARDNSILVNAPADQMAVVTEAVKVIDVPNDRTRSVLRNSNRVQAYPLQSAEPDSILKLLQELGDLNPDTRLQVDRKKRAIIAHANLADHLTIRTLIEKLDGTTRKFRVIPLKKLEADYVASSLNLVMGGGETGKRQSTRDAEDEARRFRVVADVEKNRLLMWVSEDELTDVERLLEELGEPAAEPAEPSETVKFLDATDPQTSEVILKRLKQDWKRLSPHPLELGPGTDTPSTRLDRDDANTEPIHRTPARVKPVSSDRTKPSTERLDDDDLATKGAYLADVNSALPRKLIERVREQESADSNASATPMQIDRDEKGRWILRSEDPAAVELAQQLIKQSLPNTDATFHVFRMKNKTTWAVTVADSLRQFFDERRRAEEKRLTETSTARWFDPATSKWIESSKSDPAAALKKLRPAPKLVVDEESNSILALEADEEQIRAAQKLIDLYDTPEAQESPVVRTTRLVPIQFANPRQICETLKDVYKDLISAPPETTTSTGKKRRSNDPNYTLANERGKELKGTLLRFRGQLAIGVDESSASIVISAPTALVDMVAETATALDDAARLNKPKMQVYRMGKGVDAIEVQKRLNQALKQAK